MHFRDLLATMDKCPEWSRLTKQAQQLSIWATYCNFKMVISRIVAMQCSHNKAHPGQQSEPLQLALMFVLTRLQPCPHMMGLLHLWPKLRELKKQKRKNGVTGYVLITVAWFAEDGNPTSKHCYMPKKSSETRKAQQLWVFDVTTTMTMQCLSR